MLTVTLRNIGKNKAMLYEDLLKEFDSIIEDAPVDFLGTGGDSRWANKQEKIWQEDVNRFREKLKKLTVFDKLHEIEEERKAEKELS